MSETCEQCGTKLYADGGCPTEHWHSMSPEEVEAEKAENRALDAAAREAAANAEARLARSEAAYERARANHLGLQIDGLESQGWQANPAGVSGRVVRGYKHWRHKR